MTHFIKIKIENNSWIYICGFLTMSAVFFSFFYLYLINTRIQNNFSKNNFVEKLDLIRKHHQEIEVDYIRGLALVDEKQKEYGFVEAGNVKFVSVEEKDLARVYFPVNP
ncbi:MAG: hypothetical protein AAB807_00200 [Patescibacteria group bacterium]